MKKLLCIIISIIIISSSSIAFAEVKTFNSTNATYTIAYSDENQITAPTYIGDAYRVIAKSGVNVRQGPCTEYKIIGAFAYNTIVYEDGFLETDTNGDWWYLVSNGSIMGWVKGTYLECIPN